MSILDSVKSVASEGLHLVSSAEKLASDSVGSLVKTGDNALTAVAHLPELALNTTETQAKNLVSGLGTTFNAALSTASYAWKTTDSLASSVASLLPGIAESKSLVSIGDNLLKSKTSGDTFKLQTATSLASAIPGLGALVGAAAIVGQAATAVVGGAESKPETQSGKKEKDVIFNFVSTDEWKQILTSKAAANPTDGTKSTSNPASTNDSANAVVPKARIDESGVEFERTGFDTTLSTGDKSRENQKPGQTKIDGDKAIHTDADGTVTTQTAGHTEITRGDRKLVKDVTSGIVQDVVGDRVAYQQNTNTGEQEWNTKQGLRVVESNGQYQIFAKDGSLIGSRPVQVIANELQEESQVLTNGDRMHRHLSGRIMDRVRGGLYHSLNSGKQWDVYGDGISRTLQSGETIGMMASSDAFVQIGTTTVVRKAADSKYYLISGGNTTEIKVDDQAITAPVKRAVAMLHSIDTDKKLHLGDGTFLTIRDGKVVGGTDEIVDEPVPAPAGTPIVDEPVIERKKVEVTMVTTGNDTSTSILRGGYESTYNFKSHESTINEPTKPGSTEAPKPIVTITDNSLTTDDVITTKQGTTDRVTHDVIKHDGSIQTSNGIKVSVDNDIEFADGVRFDHDGKVTLADGTVAREANTSSSAVVEQQASSALAAALTIANSVAAKAANGTITFADIALLQANIFQVQALIGSCMAAGNLEVAQSLMKTGASLDNALDSANKSFSANTALRAMRTNAPANSTGAHVAFLSDLRAA